MLSIKVINLTESRQNQKISISKQITERFLTKLGNPSQLTGEQVWKLFKGDGSGQEISIDFIRDICNQKQISLDLDRFDQILLADSQKALKNMLNQRKDNSEFIELAIQLRQNSIQTTDNSFAYMFEIDSNKLESQFKKCNSQLNKTKN